MDNEIIKKEGLLLVAQILISAGTVSIGTDIKTGVALLVVGSIILIARGYLKKNGYSVDEDSDVLQK